MSTDLLERTSPNLCLSQAYSCECSFLLIGMSPIDLIVRFANTLLVRDTYTQCLAIGIAKCRAALECSSIGPFLLFQELPAVCDDDAAKVGMAENAVLNSVWVNADASVS